MIISIDTENFKSTAMYNKKSPLGTEARYLNIIKTMYDKPTSNIIFSGEKLKVLL